MRTVTTNTLRAGHEHEHNRDHDHDHDHEEFPVKDVTLFRLYVLRAMYLFIVVGLGVYLWPSVLDPDRHWQLIQGQANCMLAAFSLVCVLGLRYPLQMLPILLWEVIWKTLWLALVPLPQWLAGHVDEAIKPSIFACGMVVLVYLAIPWRYVVAYCMQMRGARWH